MTTRAQKKTQDELESSDRRNEKESGVCPKYSYLNLTMISLLQVKRKSSTLGKRSELNVESTDEKAERKKWRRNTVLRCPPKIRPWDSRSPAVTDCGFFRKDGLLYRRWSPRRRIKMDGEVEQLRRLEVIHLAHRSPFAGHLGQDKTANRLLQRPTLYADVARTVKECQRTAPKGNARAPLIPLPLISEPF